MYGRQGELAQRLGGAGRLGDADLVAEVGQGRDVVLLGRLDELPRRPALDPRQHDVGRRHLVGLEPALEGLQELVVEVGELRRDLQPLAAIGGRLEEAIGLDQGQQLGLDDGPSLLLVGRLGDVVAVRRLVPQLDRLAERQVEVELAELVEAVPIRALAAVPPNGSGGISVIGRRSNQSVGLRVVGKCRATSTASAEGVVGLPSRRVARSGLLVKVPYRAACRLTDWPPTVGTVSPIRAPPAPGWRTPGVKGVGCTSPGAAWTRRTGGIHRRTPGWSGPGFTRSGSRRGCRRWRRGRVRGDRTTRPAVVPGIQWTPRASIRTCGTIPGCVPPWAVDSPTPASCPNGSAAPEGAWTRQKASAV